MSVYEAGKSSLNDGHLTQTELHLYGSSRLGLLRRSLRVDVIPIPDPFKISMPIFGEGDSISFGRGNKLFELSNHLGNVLASVNDKKLGVSSNNTTVDYFNPQAVSAQDYFPFGMLQPGRSYNAGGYRYGFNGLEMSNEIKGVGNSNTSEFWEYDTRLARRWNVDPVRKFWLGGYTSFRNNPLLYIDPRGNDDIFDQYGKYLGSTKKGSLIRVVNSGVSFADAQKDLNSSTKLTSDFRYCPEDLPTRNMLVQILNFYLPEIGLDQFIQLGDTKVETEGGAFAFWSKEKSYNLAVNTESGKINKSAAHKWNLINSFVHEKVHKVDPKTAQPLFHIDAILGQVKDKSFFKTQESLRRGLVSYAAELLNLALDRVSPLEEVQARIAAINNSELQSYATLVYNEKTKRVEPSALLEAVTVTKENNKNNPVDSTESNEQNKPKDEN